METIINKPYTKSNIIGIVGPKGNCKSLIMANLIILKLIEGEPVWSNMPVHTGSAILDRRHAPSGRLIKYAETQPIDYNLFYTLDNSFVDGTVAIDELGYLADSRRSSDTRNRLINMAIRQARHRNLNFYYTDRAFGRVDYRVREETDIIITPQDLSFTEEGRLNNIAGGIIANCKFYDISGQETGKSCFNGYTYDPNAYYLEATFKGRAFWDCYDTRSIISLEEACTGIDLDLEKRHISNKNKEEEKEGIKDKLRLAVERLRDSGKEEIESWAFWKYAQEGLGVTGDPSRLGRLLPREVSKRMSNGKYLYSFSRV